MKHAVKKNQMIITALAIMIAVAGYLNYSGTQLEEAVSRQTTQEDQVLMENGYELTEEGEVTDTPGEAVLTSVTGSEISASAKLTREQLRAQNKETLMEVINNDTIAEEQKQSAIDSITSLTDIAEREAAAELLLDAKGFEDSVVSITDNSADVVINMAEISDSQRAQIEDIVKRKAEIPGENIIITPISAEDLAEIKIGDIVWLDGDLMTCRDVAHRRLVEYGRELPYDIKDKAIFHAGPIVRKIEGTEDDYEMVSVGPTTSMRMEKFEYEFTKLTGVRVIVGKGGMGPNTERACKEFGAIHCVFPAGCAVVAATEVEKIVEHHWDELGMPETLWCNKVKEFGPLIVSIDAQGRNLFEENKVIFNERKEAAKQAIYPEVKFIK